MPRNPYAVPNAAERNGTAPGAMAVFGGNQRYAVKDVPESTDPDYEVGYSPQLRAGGSSSGEALPDNVRIGQRKTPIPGRNWNDPQWQAQEDSEFLRRMSEEQTEIGYTVHQEKAPTPNHPLWSQDRMPVRPTANMSPIQRTFQRPWHIPRNRKDSEGENAVIHFSLADNRRIHPIVSAPKNGMRPQGRLGVNTYRAEPRPWDENLFIPPPAGMQQGGIAGNRAWRL